jgi:hypothetical protein
MLLLGAGDGAGSQQETGQCEGLFRCKTKEKNLLDGGNKQGHPPVCTGQTRIKSATVSQLNSYGGVGFFLERGHKTENR